jgi:MFS family permease
MAMILANIAGFMYFPLLPLYLQSLGADIGEVGLFFSLSAIAPLFFQILGGWLSDSVGRWQAVAIGSLAGTLSYVVIFFAPSWEWLLISTAAGAMAVAFVAPSYQAYVAEQSTEANRGRVYGLTDSLFMLVGVIGPPVGGYLSERYGFRVMFAVAGGLYTTATLIRVIMALSSRPAAAAEDGARRRPTLAGLKTSLLAMGGLVASGGIVTWILVSDGIRDVSWNTADQFHALFMQNVAGLSKIEIGWLAAVAGFTTMVFTGPAGWLSDRKGERTGIAAGFLLVAAGLMAFIGSRTIPGFVAAWLLFGLGHAFIGPAYNSLISKVVPENLRGVAFGMFSTSVSVVSLPAPLLGAYLWDRIGPQGPFYAPMVAALIMLPLVWTKFKRPAAQTPGGANAQYASR